MQVAAAKSDGTGAEARSCTNTAPSAELCRRALDQDTSPASCRRSRHSGCEAGRWEEASERLTTVKVVLSEQFGISHDWCSESAWLHQIQPSEAGTA